MTEFPWIRRQLADEIHEQILRKPEGVYIYLIQAQAGIGKTYLARDIGTRLGSSTGYELGRIFSETDEIAWSGILDLYDPDMNSNPRIEARWIDAFATPTKFEFDSYYVQRSAYTQLGESGMVGSTVEKQRLTTEESFADGMSTAAVQCYPVIAFDTVERLQSAWDATEHELKYALEDTALVYRWLEYQFKRLPRGTILLFGRKNPRLKKDLEKLVEQANRERGASSPIVFKEWKLDYLNPQEQKLFFEHRLSMYPNLKRYMSSDLVRMLIDRTLGNPLLLDIAIQTLLETRSGDKVLTALKNSAEADIGKVEDELLKAYMESGSSARQALLYYLMVARNGLFKDLLNALAVGEDIERLHHELDKMGDLPFIKWRDILVSHLGGDERFPRRTYFFHDAMYAICERVRILGVKEVRDWSGKIGNWYDNQIKQITDISSPDSVTRRPEAVADLLIESLPYRMRTDPEGGYRWYLEQSDRAIRSAETGLDMRLKDAMSQFVVSAYERWQTSDLPLSRIDDEIIRYNFPSLVEDFRLDSALLWVKRFSVRGKNIDALEIAKKAVWVEDIYKKDPERFLAPYAEFRLWQGQALMYGREPVEAISVFANILTEIDRHYPLERLKHVIENEKLPRYRIEHLCYVAGRSHNNVGYIYWMYTGQYWLALNEFQKANEYFDLGGLGEEKANSLDNIGRVYAILGISWDSFTAIQEGLTLRQEQLHSPYREALSLTSLALHFLQFFKVRDAIETVDEALTLFRRVGIDRGQAIGLTARGLAYRMKAESWRVERKSIDAALKDIKEAETDLRTALRVFVGTVDEPLRRVRVENELACCYRAQYLLFKEKGSSDREKKDALTKGLQFYKSAIRLADEYGFFIEKLDNMQDRAVLYARASDFANTLKDLDEIRRLIPNSHKFIKGQEIDDLHPESRIDAYYKVMGLVELLHGAVIYEQGPSKDDPQQSPAREVILEMMERYVLSVAYFITAAGATFSNRRTHDRIYRRLKGYDREFLTDLCNQKIPQWIKQYCLPAQAVKISLDEVFRLLIPLRKRD